MDPGSFVIRTFPRRTHRRIGRRRECLDDLGVLYSCSRCQVDLGPDPPFVYLFHLTLADNEIPTRAWLHAWLWKEEGERFLGLPAANLYAEAELLEQVRRRLQPLLTDAAVLDCLLQSSHAPGRSYRVIQTQLVDAD